MLMPDPRIQAEYFANREEMIQNQAGIMGIPPDTLARIIDPEHVIEKIRRDLKGQILQTTFEKDEKTGVLIPKNQWVKIGKEWLNEEGVEVVISILNSYINPHTVLTKLKEERIMELIHGLARNLNKLFYERAAEFGLDNAYKSILKYKICDLVEMTLRQSQDKTLLEALTQAYSVREIKGYGEEKKSMKDMLLSPFKRGDRY